MLKKITLISLTSILFLLPVSEAKRLSDTDIRNLLIKESIESYSGSCPCPYNTTRNGSSCGKRSAYSKPGGESPLCFPNDVTEQMIKNYRQSH